MPESTPHSNPELYREDAPPFAAPGPHPPLDQLLAASEGVLPEPAQARVLAHLTTCRLCTGLLEDLATLPEPELSPAQLQAIAAKLPAVVPAKQSWLSRGRALAAIAAAAIFCITAWTFHRHSLPPVQIAKVEPVPAPTFRPYELPLTPLALPPDEAPRLLTRGAHADKNPPPSELRTAFAAYTAGHYEQAAQQFHALSPIYPHSDLIPLYLGVSQLYLNQNAEAAASLATARRNTPHSDAATWYAAIAAQRLHTGETRALLTDLCHRSPSAYAVQSCQALQDLP